MLMFLTTLWLGVLCTFNMWLYEYFLNGGVVTVKKHENVLRKCKCSIWPNVLVICEPKSEK